MFFTNSYSCTPDAKKRIFVPSKFRDELSSSFYITRNPNLDFLSVYTMDEWEQFVTRLNRIPESAGGGDLREFYLSVAQKFEPDSNGRIIISDTLLSWIGVEKSEVITFVGAGSRINIWPERKWKEKEQKRDLNALRQAMLDNGL